MKKPLLLISFILFFCGNGFSDEIILNCEINDGYTEYKDGSKKPKNMELFGNSKIELIIDEVLKTIKMDDIYGERETLPSKWNNNEILFDNKLPNFFPEPYYSLDRSLKNLEYKLVYDPNPDEKRFVNVDNYNCEKKIEKNKSNKNQVISTKSDFKSYINELKLEEIINVLEICSFPSSFGQKCKMDNFNPLNLFKEFSITLDKDKITYTDKNLWNYHFTIKEKSPSETIIEFEDQAIVGTYLSTQLIKFKYSSSEGIWKLHSIKETFPDEENNFKIISK